MYELPKITPSPNKSENGAVLLIALIFLAILSVVGSTAMKMTQVDTKISGNFIDKQVAFSAANSAMVKAQLDLKIIVADFDESKVTSKYSSNCTNGYCFDGTYAGGSCSVNQSSWSPDDGVFQNEAIWNENAIKISDKLGAASEAKYLIEFRCFGADTTEPKFRLIAVGTGREDSSRTMLISEYDVGADGELNSVAGVIAINGHMEATNTSSVDAYYCSIGCQRNGSGKLNHTFDPEEVPGIAYSSCNNPGACSDSVAGGIVNVAGNSNEEYSATTIANKDGDDFFEQYFSQSKAEVKARGETLEIDLDLLEDGPDAFKSLSKSDIAAYDTIYVKGDVDLWASYNTLMNVLDSSKILVIDGDVSGQGTINAGFVYVEGDYNQFGAVTLNGFIAVEGNADVNGALVAYPGSNPLEANYPSGSSTSSELAVQSWYQTPMQF